MNLDEYKYMTNSVHVKPFGIPTAQTWNQLGSLFDDLNRMEITTFFELGAYMGGLSDLMIYRQSVINGFKFLGVQLDAQEINIRLRGTPYIMVGDVFSQEVIKRISGMIAESSGAVMVYCDNGNKPLELRTYAPILRVGDYIRAHDYPGETTQESLDIFRKDFPYMEEMDIEKYHELGLSLWRRVG